jgi:capsular exopolysaccharide synthesis family protein
MSEFFKALEQAERDRLRQDQAEATSAPPVSRPAAQEQGSRASRTVTPEPAPASPEATKAPVAEPPVTRPPFFRPPASKPAVAKAPVKPAVSRPVAAKPAAVPPAVTSEAVPLEPAPAGPGSPRGGLFRPSLQAPRRPRFGGRLNGRQPRLVTQTNPNSIEADAYRTLRANIELMAEERAFRHIAITSAGGGDGKSTTAANLAVVTAQGGRRVCLVDSDLRRPTLHDIFGLPNVDGLTLALEEGKALSAVARPTDVPNLSVVVAGRGVHERGHDMLTAQRLESILHESETAFDLVIFDSPPVISVADALSVAAVCEGVILVVRSGSAPFTVLERAIGQIKQVKGRVLGVLLNQVDLRAADADSYRYYRAYHAARKSER